MRIYQKDRVPKFADNLQTQATGLIIEWTLTDSFKFKGSGPGFEQHSQHNINI